METPSVHPLFPERPLRCGQRASGAFDGNELERRIFGKRDAGRPLTSAAIGEGNRDRALRLVTTMLRNREPALLIQGALLRQLRQIWRAQELAGRGVPRGEIAGATGVPAFFLDEILGPARRMSASALRRGFERLYQADLQLKSSRIDDELLVTRLVRRLVEDAGARPGR